MKFRTEIELKNAPFTLNPERLILLTGSCFSDNIGEKIKNASWKSEVNPCGVIYNPVSMGLLYQLALSPRMMRRNILESAVTTREDKFVTWFMDSKVMATDRESVIEMAMEKLDLLESALETADCMIVTFGTSEVFLLSGTDNAVGNCHKHPASEFNKTRLDIKDTVNLWTGIIKAIRERNPQIKVVLTVSPIRYQGDGFAENSRKKAVLLLACEQICKVFKDVCYFPAYEIMNDDLRDYRFYADDLIHPSSRAIEYIWEKFCSYFLDRAGREKIKEGEKKYRSSRHRQLFND